ncbi:MAG: hypothetical protein GC188_12880 [Alphaproteobacteria bacterium]|nr:hypothetical protein [Alphaproteobacteria bacterium]
MTSIQPFSNVKCPSCGKITEQVRMPENACIYFWDCPSCGDVIRPLPPDCCVFCSYGTVPCPPVQLDAGCCDSSSERI